MASSSMASLLFSVVLLGFVVKNVDGVRGPPQPEAMVELEVTSWRKDPCEKYGAKKKKATCECPPDRPMRTKECGHSLSDLFYSDLAKPGCRCVTLAELQERLRLPVAASALRFCEAVAEHGRHEAVDQEAMDQEAMTETRMKINRREIAMRDAMNSAVATTSPEICQHALVGTINKTEAQKAPWAKEASEISHKGSDEDAEDRDAKYGRMRAVKESATNSTEKALWEHALARVCKDECEELLKMMKKKADGLTIDVVERKHPFAQTCAERVVKQVEAEVLGCCARSCGFNGQTCLLWPFFSEEEKVNWNVECCSEMSVLKNSSRERMCNSVLSSRLATAASQYDLNEQAGTDVGKVLIGQNSSLVWTKAGARKLGFKKGDKVSIEFLIKHKKVGEEYLRLGYFKEKPISQMLDESTSLMEVSSQGDTCNFGKFKEQCPKKFITTFVKKCNEAWNVTQDSEDSEETNFRDLLLHEKEGHCNESDSQDFSTPEECEQLEVNSFGKVFLHYFKYNRENKVLPIKCFSVSKKQCKGPKKDDWWKRITSVSVQKLINEQDVSDYTDLVYVKVKADE